MPRGIYEVEPRFVTAILRGAGLSSLTARLSRYSLVVTIVLKVAGELRVGFIRSHRNAPKKCKLTVFFKNDTEQNNNVSIPTLPNNLRLIHLTDYKPNKMLWRRLEVKIYPTVAGYIAERAGFEPANGFRPLQTFQVCLFSHSSTFP